MSYIYDLTDTWNAGGTTFTAIKMDVLDTASAAGSLLLDLQVGGSSKFKVTKAGVTLASDGVLATPAYSFSAETGSGLFRTATRNIVLGVNGTAVLGATDNGGNAVRLANAALEWTTNIGNGGDTILARDAANTLALRNSTNAQAFRVYNTFTDASNYERLGLLFASGAFQVMAEKGGTGAARSLYLGTNNTLRWYLDGSSGHFLAATDNTNDIGAPGANRPRNIYFGTLCVGGNFQAVASGYFQWANGTSIKSPSDGVIAIYDNAGTSFGRLQFGGTTSSFPALKRSSATLQARLADDSAFAAVAGLVDLTATQAADSIGTRGVPQNSQSAAYTLVIEDAGKHILHPSADTTARTFTIPANGSVTFPVGTVVTFVNQNAGGVITIAITTDTMRLAGAGTTGSRTLAANGIATAIKVTSTEWLISGTGLT